MKLFFYSALFLVSFAATAQDRTDLGITGNEYVASHFLQHKMSAPICAPPNLGQSRVIITGFGPFSGSAQNISGEILKAFGKFESPLPITDAYGAMGEISSAPSNIQVCFLVLSTTWDLAAAILVHEAQVFEPHMVLMTGLGGSNMVFELDSVNQATFLEGYEPAGKELDHNQPVANYVLPLDSPGVLPRIALTWKPQDLLPEIQQDVLSQGFYAAVESTQTSPDNYICNNIRYVMAHAAKNTEIVLAGGNVRITPRFRQPPITGFIHYPMGIATTPSSLTAWSNILEKVIVKTLNN